MMTEEEIAAAMEPPPGFVFLGWYLPGVRTVFNSPSRGLEERFVPVFAKDDWQSVQSIEARRKAR